MDRIDLQGDLLRVSGKAVNILEVLNSPGFLQHIMSLLLTSVPSMLEEWYKYADQLWESDSRH